MIKRELGKRCIFHLVFCLTALLHGVIGYSQALTPQQIDSVVKKSMQSFKVPGMAVAVLKDGDILLKKGYGVSSIETEKPVDTHTIFGIASNTKAFTSAGLAQLIDAGKLDWDTKVTDIIPEFKLYDAYVTREFTVRDLLTHRSGLGLGAGDLMLWPTSNTTTLEELIHNMRYLKPVSSFRSKYAYDNLLYIIAGEIIARVSGDTFENYIREHIFKPLEMKDALVDLKKIQQNGNHIKGHSLVDGKLQAITRKPFTENTKAAGGIFASVDDMTKWIKARLNKGRFNKSDSLFSVKQAKEMWTSQTIIPTGDEEYNTHFKTYGLGWRLQDVNGYKQVWHTGALSGMVSKVTLIPELDLGIIVLTNGGVGAAYNVVTNSILDSYFGNKTNRIAQYKNERKSAIKKAEQVENRVEGQIQKQLNNKMLGLNHDQIIGVYKDDWFGKITIEEDDDGVLWFHAKKSPDLRGEMQYYKGTTYVIRWEDRTIKADAFINFKYNSRGQNITEFLMEAISPLTDFSYDFQDLSFKRVE